MQLRAVTGQMLLVGVVKQWRRITSANECMGCLNWCQFRGRSVKDRGGLVMNLYRSFGNLMEAWVAEGGQCSDSDWTGNNDEGSPTPSSDSGTNLRSESVDSGVETASSETSFPATSCSASTDNAELDTFTSEREVSTSPSPVLSSPAPSSSSPQVSPRVQEDSSALHLKVEQALQRTASKCQRDKTEPLTVDEVLRRRPRASLQPKRNTSAIVRGQRSESFGPRRTVNPSAPVRQMSLNCDQRLAQTRSEDFGEEDGRGLSPGLSYLEQVCQLLEEIARQQMHSRVLQTEMEALREHQDVECPDTCQSDSKAAEEEDRSSSLRRLENTERAENGSVKSQRRKDAHRHFRQRSVSDTTIASLHLRKLNTDCRGQHLSTDRLEKVEEENQFQDSKKEETKKINKNWKLKIGSLRREAGRDANGQQTQSPEKNSTRRRLSQLFRRRRKTLPM